MYKMSPEIQYCMFGSFECLEITSDLLLAVRLMDIDVDAVWDERNGNPVENLKTMYHSWYDRMATDIEKSLLAYYFLTESSTQIKDIANAVTTNLKIKYFGKKYIEQQNKYLLGGINRNKYSLKEVSRFRDLLSKKNLEEAFNCDEHITRFHQEFFITYKVLTSNIKHSFQEVMSYYYSKYCRTNDRDLFVPGFFENELLENNKPKVEKKLLSLKKQTHKIFNKSFNVLNKFLGNEQTKSFIKKEEIKIEGNLFNYIIINKGNLLKNTIKMDGLHIPFTLKLYNKKWEYLSELCVVFPGSPVLDQVLSVYLMIKSGEEETLLKSANLYGLKSDLIYKEQFLIDIKKVNPKKEVKLLNNQNYVSGISEETKSKKIVVSKLKENTIKNNRNLIKEKAINLFFKKMGIPKNIQKELSNQELCWDEKLDYISVNIEMPEVMDIYYKQNLLKKEDNKQLNCFNNNLLS